MSTLVVVSGTSYLFNGYEELLRFLLKERAEGRRAKVEYVDRKGPRL